MRKSRKLRRSHKTKKRQRGGWSWWPFGSSEEKKEPTPPVIEKQPNSTNVSPVNVSKNAKAANANSQNGKTTQVVNPTTGGMAPINMKEPMFYPTQRQLEWATTAGLPCTKGGRSKRRVTRNKKSKRKSRR